MTDYMLREIDAKILRYLLRHSTHSITGTRLLRNVASGVSVYRKQASTALHRMQRHGLVRQCDASYAWELTDLGRRLADESQATLREDLKILGVGDAEAGHV